MKKRILALILSCMVAVGAVGCGSGGSVGTSAENSGESNGDYTKLVVAYRTFGTTPSEEGVKAVEEALNEITREKIGAEVELMILASGSYVNQMNLMLTGDEQLDVMGATKSMISSAYAAEQIKPLQELLDEHGQGIKEVLGEELLRCGEYGGELYNIPIKCETATGQGAYLLRKDICDKYGIDASAIDSYEKLTEAFAIVHENEPNMTVVTTGSVGQSFLQTNTSWDALGDTFGVLDHHGETLDVVNLYETESYRNFIDVVRDWYQKGYISKDVTNATEAGASMMKAGNLFAYSTASKPGIVTQEENMSGQKLELCQVLPNLTTTGNIWQWTIPENCDNPDKAMQFLNLMYTDPEVINLMAYGIEGTHYIVQEDGTANYPEGVDATTCGYNLGTMLWSFGNEFNAYVWAGNDIDLWEQTEEWNKTGIVSKAYGFVFDPSPISNEKAAVTNAYKQYCMSLECGVVDPDTAIKEMNEKLYTAGLQTIIDEKQKQLDEWAKEHNIE